MTVAATSYEAQQSAAIVQLIADSATFQTATGTVTGAAAKAFIIEDDGGAPTTTAVDGSTLDIAAACWATVRLGPTRRPQRAQGTFGHEGDAAVMLVVQAVDGDTAADSFRRTRNIAGAIAAEMLALVGSGATRPCYLTAALGEIIRSDEASALRGAYLAPLAISWRDIP